MIDEAQTIAKMNSKANEMASRLWRRHAWVVSGTPVTKNLGDLRVSSRPLRETIKRAFCRHPLDRHGGMVSSPPQSPRGHGVVTPSIAMGAWCCHPLNRHGAWCCQPLNPDMSSHAHPAQHRRMVPALLKFGHIPSHALRKMTWAHGACVSYTITGTITCTLQNMYKRMVPSLPKP